MSTIRTSNNPAMLVWAREEVGYTIDQAAEALGVSVETLLAAEEGSRPLTLSQLRKAADSYNCPFGYFYLSQAPHKKSFEPVPDYRLNPEYIGVPHFRLNLEINKARQHRATFLDIAERQNIELKPFVVNNRPSGRSIRARLGIVTKDIQKLSFDEAYSFWKSKIEEDGVLVYESQYIPEESGVIGVALYYETCPIVLIKRGGNLNSRKLFTLLHEYAHLIFGQSGINDSASQIATHEASPIESLETKCNRLAADILVPDYEIDTNEYINLSPEKRMERLASSFKITYSAAAVCLKRFGLIDDKQLTQLMNLRREAYEDEKKLKPPAEVRIPRENIMRLDLGKPLFNIVLKAYANGVLDVFDAAQILSLRVKKIDKLLAGVHE